MGRERVAHQANALAGLIVASGVCPDLASALEQLRARYKTTSSKAVVDPLCLAYALVIERIEDI